MRDPVETTPAPRVGPSAHAGRADPFVYVLVGDAELAAAKARGALHRASLRTEGFLHASPLDQLTRVANKHYADVVDLRVLVVRTVALDVPVRWEPATGGLYPHIYGPMDMGAVERVVPVQKGADGRFHITAADVAP